MHQRPNNILKTFRPMHIKVIVINQSNVCDLLKFKLKLFSKICT